MHFSGPWLRNSHLPPVCGVVLATAEWLTGSVASITINVRRASSFLVFFYFLATFLSILLGAENSSTPEFSILQVPTDPTVNIGAPDINIGATASNLLVSFHYLFTLVLRFTFGSNSGIFVFAKFGGYLRCLLCALSVVSKSSIVSDQARFIPE